jgi:hypothetical protein
MAKLKDPDMTKHYEELAERYLNCLKYRLKQDGAEFRDQIVEWFGKWLVAKPKRISRYEAADLKLVDEFIDFAWASIKDSSVPMPPAEEPEAKQLREPRARNNWWGQAEAGGAINWREVARQIAQAPPANAVGIDNIGIQQAGQLVFDPDVPGNWRVVNR